MLAHSPLILLAIICATAAFLCWLISVLTRNNSQVDRLWSILPPIYVTCFAVWDGFRDARLGLMSLLTILWGVRLTYNLARKGGYRRGSEDYRWPVLRERMGPVRFQIFNVLFIALFQNILLLLLAGPAYLAWSHRHQPLMYLDLLATAGFLLFLAGQTIADEQQWRFQQAKREALARGEPVDPPFLTRGLFRYSRHPNFFCELAMWWCIYLFSVAATGQWLNPSIAGALFLTLLFHGSTAFTEELSLARYPAYAEYQRTTSRLWPLPPRRAR